MEKNFNAVIFGSTGGIGMKVLTKLNETKSCSKIFAFTRRSFDEEFLKSNSKIQEVLWKDFGTHLDFFSKKEKPSSTTIKQLKKMDASVCFSCMGTTSKQAKNKQYYEDLTKNYSVAIGEICKESGIPYHFFVSSEGANSSSWFSYPRMKGEVEEHLKQLKFKGMAIIQPALLVGAQRRDYRFAEKSASYITSFLNIFGFNFDIHVAAVAYAMVNYFVKNFSKDKGFCETITTKELKEYSDMY